MPMNDTSDTQSPAPAAKPAAPSPPPPPPPEVGGPKEADPTRYGDWTVKGRCIDF